MTATGSDAYLIFEASSRIVPLATGKSWAIGRSDNCAVVLDSRSVSRLHALIQRMDTGSFCLIDLGSRNGSFVNGRRVSIPVTLQDKDKMVFGSEQLRFRQPSASSSVPVAEDGPRSAPTTSLMSHTNTTIVVVDIRDFTPMARAVSEELLSQMIGTWFLRVGQITQERGSWAQKYIGDAVMALWLHDEPSNTRRELLGALEAVCEIERATAEISRSLPLPAPLRIGAGINTGPAIVGNADNTALGDSVTMAFRLEAATKTIGLGVALGEPAFRTLDLSAGLAGCFERRDVELKGYEGVNTAWGISFEGLEEFLRRQIPSRQ